MLKSISWIPGMLWLLAACLVGMIIQVTGCQRPAAGAADPTAPAQVTAPSPATPSPTPVVTTPAAEPTDVTAAKLWETFKTNSATGDATYTGRPVRVSGEIGKVTKDGGDYVVKIVAETRIDSTLGKVTRIVGVHCRFTDGGAVASLKAGARVKIVGTVTGYADRVVTVTGCVVVD